MRFRLSMLALPAALLSTPLALLAQGHGEEGGGGLFDINWGLSIWTVIIFMSVLTVLWRYAFGPILAAVNAREEGINKALEEARSRQEEAEKLLEEHKAQLADARRQAQEIMAEGRDAAGRLRPRAGMLQGACRRSWRGRLGRRAKPFWSGPEPRSSGKRMPPWMFSAGKR